MSNILFVSRNQRLIIRLYNRVSHRNLSLSAKTVSRTRHDLITKSVQSLLVPGSVIISNVDNIYDNLALEEWFYRNYDFSVNNEQILLLWRNRPAVVIGRHQNIWLETMVDYCRRNQIDIARRNSGGGTVYHDMNNLNISFMTSRKHYDRTKNLNFISRILRDCFQIKTEISPRKDLIICDGGHKISGTASKLNGYNSYHHCTLLVDVDRKRLRNSLRLDPIDYVKTNATKSVPSPIVNLNTINPSITIQSLIQAISNNYGKHYSGDEPTNLVNHIDQIGTEQFGQIVKDIQNQFESWQWIYGSTPKFSVYQNFHFGSKEYELEIMVEKGSIQQFSINTDRIPREISESLEIIQKSLEGIRFEEADLNDKILTIIQNQPESSQIICLAIFAAYKRIVGA